MSETRRLAAIDIGTVTTRLLVADVGPGGVTEVERSTDITHLGEGLTAMATSASRDAANSDDFLALLAEHGVLPAVIAGDREARLSFAGATIDIGECEDLLVVDLGGGSTELIVGNVAEKDGVLTPEIVKARSLDVGSKRVTELFLHSDPPTQTQLAEARAWVTAQLRPYFDGLRDRPEEMVALAGTATSLSAIRQQLKIYDPALVHCSCLSGSDLADLVDELAALPLERRKQVPGLDPGRASVIVAGALILETIVALAGLDSTLVSEHDILYGILLDTYDELRRGGEAVAGEAE